MAAWQMAAMLYQMEQCKQNPNATCCNDSAVNRNVTFVDCPLPDCEGVIVSHLRQAVNIAGCLGLIFSFTEVIGIWLALRYRNLKDPRANPGAFL